MPKKRAHSFEELEAQQSKMDTTDEEVLEQKPDRDALEKWASDVLFKLEEIHEDVRDLQDEVAYVTSQVDDLQS
jgi:archaellum component FlaC